MALDKSFYNDIFEHEQKWTELINSNLLNSIYCNLTLKPFYIQKKEKLEEEYNKTNNEIIKQIILIIDNIIDKIELFNYKYVNYQKPNINSLLTFFLTTKMNNILDKEDKNNENQNEIDKVHIRKQILEIQIENIDRTLEYEPDYVYEDFPQEVRRIK